MAEYSELFESIRKQPGMFVQPPSYPTVAALLLGFDLGRSGGVLAGFREWLVVKADDGSNLVWSALVLRIAFPGRPEWHDPSRLPGDADGTAIGILFDLLVQFLEEREEVGLRGVYVSYENWLRRQPWYGPDSPHWRG